MSALTLIGLSELAGQLEHFLFTWCPKEAGFGSYAWPWVLLMLTLAGVVVGLIVWKVPGHAGPDPATLGLVEAPMPVGVLPGVGMAAVAALGMGVSLGPENPIIGINVGLTGALGRRIAPNAPIAAWVALAASGTIGALFGTPVAAALLLSEMAADPETPLWDRLFAPLVAAGAGSMTAYLISEPTFTVAVPKAPPFGYADVGWAMLIAAGAAVVGLVAVYVFPLLHRLFHGVKHPMPQLVAGGVALGLLGVLGGPLTLFKGFSQMKQLVPTAAQHSTGNLLLLAVVKIVAMTVASASGFRGGRIFPATFVGVALGLFVNSADSSAPEAVAIAAGILGYVLAVSRQGWLSLLLAATVTGDVALLPVLCLALLPAWLIVTGRPMMQIGAPASAAAPVGEAP
jgi:H+/Cl- antiporter ClcA